MYTQPNNLNELRTKFEKQALYREYYKAMGQFESKYKPILSCVELWYEAQYYIKVFLQSEDPEYRILALYDELVNKYTSVSTGNIDSSFINNYTPQQSQVVMMFVFARIYAMLKVSDKENINKYTITLLDFLNRKIGGPKIITKIDQFITDDIISKNKFDYTDTTSIPEDNEQYDTSEDIEKLHLQITELKQQLKNKENEILQLKSSIKELVDTIETRKDLQFVKKGWSARKACIYNYAIGLITQVDFATDTKNATKVMAQDWLANMYGGSPRTFKDFITPDFKDQQTRIDAMDIIKNCPFPEIIKKIQAELNSYRDELEEDSTYYS